MTTVCERCGDSFSHDHHGARFCSYRCMYGTPEQRFWAQVDRRDGAACWPWSGSVNPYGLIRVGSRKVPAHRFAWQLANGPIPAGLWVLHKCDNPPCVNPAHLFLGTRLDNIDDMLSKRRQRGAVGAKNPKAKLTEAQAMEIRFGEERSIAKTAMRYGISKSQAFAVLSGRSWRHIGDRVVTGAVVVGYLEGSKKTKGAR